MKKNLVKISVTAMALTVVVGNPFTSMANSNYSITEFDNGAMIVIGGDCFSGDVTGSIPNIPNIPGFPTIPQLPTIPNVPQPDETPDLEDGQVENQSVATDVLNLVNEEREKYGIAPLVLSSQGNQAANIRAKEIVTSFSHTRPNGSNFNTALKEQGIAFVVYGENIAYGPSSAAEVMNGWMNSESHRNNIMNGQFQTMGVGHYISPQGVEYWVQLFY